MLRRLVPMVCERRQVLLVKWIDRSSGEPLRGTPKVANVVDDRRAARQAREQIRTARPVFDDNAMMFQHGVEQARAALAFAQPRLRLGPSGENGRGAGAIAPMALG